MKKILYITVALLFVNNVLLAQKPSSLEIDNSYIKVITMDKGIKRTVLIPKDDTVKKQMSSMKAEQAVSKDGIIVSFKDSSKVLIRAFEEKYKLKLQHKLHIGYYIFTNVSKLSDIRIVEDIIQNETNVETVKPNWEMTNTTR